MPAGPSMVVGQLNDLLYLKITRNNEEKIAEKVKNDVNCEK